ncbi:MAG: NUDIX domain-containing protein [Bacilli bacterium]|nr:NUDIX domain-containing protein [Bacilli bacterium]
MKKEKSCGTIVIKDSQILIIKSKSGLYGFPKGHIEKGETEKETAIRETKEETNIDVKIIGNYRFSLSYTVNGNINKEVIYFIAKPINNIEVKAQESEVELVDWIDINKVNSLLEFDNIKEVWRQVYNILENRGV